MSKAFTRESDDPTDELPEEPEPQLPPGARNYITAAGARRLRDELERLQGEWAARAGGEPGAAHDDPGTARLRREAERRVRHLARRLQSVEPVEPPAAPARVVFGATVTLRDEEDRVRRYRIVGLDEADARRGDVSWLSPVAQALLRAEVGDLVTVRTPHGDEELEVTAITGELPA